MEQVNIIDVLQLPAMGLLAFLLVQSDRRAERFQNRLFDLVDSLTKRIEFMERAQGIDRHRDMNKD